MTKEILEKIINKVYNDLQQFEKETKEKGIDYVYGNAYKIDFAQSIEEYFDDLRYWETRYEDISQIDENLQTILSFDENIVEKLWDYYRNISNSEYNFDDMQDFEEMIYRAIIYYKGE